MASNISEVRNSLLFQRQSINLECEREEREDDRESAALDKVMSHLELFDPDKRAFFLELSRRNEKRQLLKSAHWLLKVRIIDLSIELLDGGLGRDRKDVEAEMRRIQQSEQEVSLAKTIYSLIKKEHMPKIFWIAHASDGDEKVFAVKGINITLPAYYGCKNLGHIFREKVLKVIENSHNEFLKWLYQKQPVAPQDQCAIEEFFICHLPENADKPFYRDIPIFMNCADFVYFTLFHAGLIKKEEILKQYTQTRENQIARLSPEFPDPLPGAKPFYYGFDLRHFVPFEAKQDIAGAGCGDILIGFSKKTKKPEHILFLSHFDQDAGWKAVSLWSSHNGGPNVAQIAIKDFEDSYTFQYCHMKTALQHLEIRN